MLDRWDLVELDLQDIGIDVRDADLLSRRTWPWLRNRIIGLLSRPHSVTPAGSVLWTTRLQGALIKEG